MLHVTRTPTGEVKESRLGLRVLDARGRPGPAETDVSGGIETQHGFAYGGLVGVAFDRRRGRMLVAFEGSGPGMASETTTCAAAPGMTPPPCTFTDSEVFVRVLDAAGQPLGDVHRVTDTGPPESARVTGGEPEVVYDPRTGGYLLVYVAHLSGDPFHGEYRVLRLDADGVPVAPGARLPVKPGGETLLPRARLAAHGRHVLLAFTWARGDGYLTTYATGLGADGSPGKVHTVAVQDALAGLTASARRSEALVLTFTATERSTGYRLRRLRLDGRAAAAGHTVSGGNLQALVAAPRTGGTGWLLAGFDKRRPGDTSERVFSLRADRDGKPVGRRHTLAGAGPYFGLHIAPLRGGRAVAGWSSYSTPGVPERWRLQRFG